MSVSSSPAAEVQQASPANNTNTLDEKDVATNIAAGGPNHEPAAEPPFEPASVSQEVPQETYKQLNELPKSLSIVLWLFVFLTAYAQGLNSSTLFTYINNALAEFGQIVQYTTLVTLEFILIAAARAPLARLSDIFGRVILWFGGVIFTVIGNIVVASSSGFHAMLAGVVFYSFGSCALGMAQFLTVADLFPPRYRALVENLINMETFINLVSAPSIAGAMIPARWRWGVGISAILLPITTTPIVVVLYYMQWRIRKAHGVQGGKYHGLSALQVCRELLLDMDPLGLVCFAGGFMLVLLPLTISDRAPDGYHTPYIIAMFVTGGVLLLLWPVVETRVPRPLIQLRTFFLNPNTLVPTAIYFIDEVAYAFISVPMLQWSEITLGLSAGNATYLTYAQAASTTVFGIVAGLITARTARYKWLTTAGACIRILGLGIMFRYRVGGSSVGQVVVPQIIMGIGGGFMTANLFAAAQASVPFAQLATVTAFVSTAVPVGWSIGSAIVGALQTNLKGELHKYVDPVAGGNGTVADLIYAHGSTALVNYPLGTPIRTAAIEAWSENMRRILTGALVIAGLNIVSTLFLPDNILASENQAEGDEAFVPALTALPEGPAEKKIED
ncbi:hypothetical protein SEUCBS140593_001344 [Sporothrix eucalyptigena]|uniref:Major facilitator superfamily (MFS) profile domain-containing protein n=1 Tax=Sporothrix eucalyptigena TaxID=1812306 RepID=A0ABP0AXI0_9PEZI